MSIFISFKSFLKNNKITKHFFSLINLNKQLKIYYLIYDIIYFIYFRYKIKKNYPISDSNTRFIFIEGSISRDRFGNNQIIANLPSNVFGLSVFHLSHRNFIRALKPDIVIIPEGYSLYLEYVINFCRKKQVKIVTLYAEGALVPETEEFWGNGIETDFEIVWGPIALKILSKYRINKHKLAYCGNPRFDIHYNHIINKNKIDIDRITILYATSFPHFDLDISADPSLLVHDLEKLKNIRNQNFKIFLESVEAFPHYNFILRTHPMEKDTYYKDYVNNKLPKNLSIYQPSKNSPTIYELLNMISLICVWGSTVSTEAWFYNLPTISLQSMKYPLYKELTGSGGSDIIHDSEGLIDAIKYYLEDKNRIKSHHKIFRDKYINDWYYKIDGKSTERVISELMNLTCQSIDKREK